MAMFPIVTLQEVADIFGISQATDSFVKCLEISETDHSNKRVKVLVCFFCFFLGYNQDYSLYTITSFKERHAVSSTNDTPSTNSSHTSGSENGISPILNSKIAEISTDPRDFIPINRIQAHNINGKYKRGS